jgi:hypothetical protein
VVSAIPSFSFFSQTHQINMQTCSVLVALNGSNDTVILKEGVTVPEVVVLMAGHGRHSVTRVPGTVNTLDAELTAKVECDRLVRCYGEETVGIAFGANRFNLTLPDNFDAIDFNEVDPYAGIASVNKETEEVDAEEVKPTAKKAAKKSVTPFDA